MIVKEFLDSLPENKRMEWYKFLTSSTPHDPVEWAKAGRSKDKVNEDIPQCELAPSL